MSRFNDFNAENKLRIPLSAYAAQTIENDCMSFSKKRTTLLNTIILNYYKEANCSISLRILDYKKELLSYFRKTELSKHEDVINKIILGRAKELKNRYAKRQKSDVNWQTTLNKKVKELLTMDPYTQEEDYYGNKPGHYVQSLIEEYARQPFYVREEIIYRPILNTIAEAISGKSVLNITNIKGNHISIKPFTITTDPMSMYHYIIGYSVTPTSLIKEKEKRYEDHVISIRLSRITDAEIQYLQSGEISISEKIQITNELQEKGVQFVSGQTSTIKVWLSDSGIKKYNSQLHLRPTGSKDEGDEHIYYFECTEAQILYYFIGFGKDAKILYPSSLSEKFKDIYRDALDAYNS